MAPIIKFMPKDRAELYAFLVLLVALLQLAVSLKPADNPILTPEQIVKIIDQVHEPDNPAPAPLPSQGGAEHGDLGDLEPNQPFSDGIDGQGPRSTYPCDHGPDRFGDSRAD